MRVFISTSGTSLDDDVSPIFGRAKQFLIVDTETMETSVLPNPAVTASGGAGVQSSQYILQKGAEAVISGNMGPNALQVLNPAGIAVYVAEGGTMRAAIEALKAGTLTQVNAPTVNKDFGKTGLTLRRGPGQGGGGGQGRGERSEG